MTIWRVAWRTIGLDDHREDYETETAAEARYNELAADQRVTAYLYPIPVIDPQEAA